MTGHSADAPSGAGRTELLIVAAPGLLAMAFVLTVFADSGSVLESLPRPLVVATLGAIALQLLVILVLRSVRAGSFVALMLLAIIVSPLWGVTIGLISGVIVLVGRWRGFSTAPITRFAGAVVAISLLVAVVRAVASPAFSLGDLGRDGPAVGDGASSADAPDIFLLMLDGYPRSDTLASWGYDNRWFTDGLAERGFEVAGASHTNYPLTALALTTMFHMRHAAEIEVLNGVPARLDLQQRAIRRALEEPPALRRLGELGYETITAGRPADYVTLDTNRLIDGGWLNEFEHQVLARTGLSGITVPVILDARRGEILETLQAAPVVAAEDGPTFMFAHVVSPHLPFLFDRDGQQPVMRCAACTFATHFDNSGMTREEFLAAYADQTDYLNHLVLDALDGIIERSPDAIVIVFSDHGSRADRVPDEDWYATFFAARTPGHAGVFPDDARPIEIFPRLLGTYFGDEIRIPDDVDFLAPDGFQMPLHIVPRSE